MNFDLIEQEAPVGSRIRRTQAYPRLVETEGKEELCDEHGIVFQYPDFAFLLSEIKTV